MPRGPVSDKVWREMRARALKMGRKVVKVGVIGASALQEADDDAGITIGRLAGVHEYGAAIQTKNGVILIPERSFIRAPLAAARTQITKLAGDLSAKVLEGKITEDRALGLVGVTAVGVIQKAIAAGIAPPNAPSTIEAKGSSKPLVDTGRLRQSISWAVTGLIDAKE